MQTDHSVAGSANRGSGIPSASRSMVVAVVALFFIWGGITSLNDVLIPKLKELFQLSYTQAMLVQFAFFSAYALVSLPAGGFVARLGYGRGIAAGLATMSAGCLLFVPAAIGANYWVFLGGLFILAGGITILQVAANPLIANLGAPESAHSRLTLAQAFNSLGTTVMPFVGAQLMLRDIAQVSSASLSGEALAHYQARETWVIGESYVGLALVLIVIAAAFWYWRALFEIEGSTAAAQKGSWEVLKKHPRLAFGVLAIFLYVGAEVAIGSALVNYLMLPTTLGLEERTAGRYISLYWGGAMVGRFIGAMILRRMPAGVVLGAVAVGATLLVLGSAASQGPFAGWTLVAVGLTNAIMFPTIFSLACAGMGAETSRASGLLCMAIVGGAIVPVVTGAVADLTGISGALVVPALCYVVIAAFGWKYRGGTAA